MTKLVDKLVKPLRKIFDTVLDSFEPEDENTLKDIEDDTIDLDLSTFDEEATGIYNLEDESIEDLTKYWWYKESEKKQDTPVFEAIDDDKVCKELLERIDAGEFPVIEIPDTIMRTMQILNNPDFDYNEVAELVNHSPAMSGEFIKVTNSSVYSRGVEVQNLNLALPRLGKENIRAMLFMYSSKLSLANNPLFNDLAVNIVNHSYATGLIAAYLSQRYFPDPDIAFLAGLLHDIGKLGILKAISQMYELPTEVDFEMNEKIFCNIFPHIHEKAGLYLGKNWKLNKIVLAAISHHHDFWDTPFDENSQVELHLSALINLSDTMARMLEYGNHIDEEVNVFTSPSSVHLNFEKDYEAIKFIEDIPKIITFKTDEK